ncbi:unnamed protein product [Adineta ricciae]|uniref:Uncharacterized protein n=1 Tax=Adineta ricciae TaxID=249248 RepID=A0A813W0W6_ADIRI|nr:unnamed protein product [Adineta ricciae]CAF1287962.1 unnamed protein product [Adineta ricciae]
MATDETTNEESTSASKEKFCEVDGGAALYENGLMAKYCYRALGKYPILYGYKRYSTGTHRIKFRIEKRGDLRCFFGIGTTCEEVKRMISVETDNRSLYGWWGLNSYVINGKVQRNKEKNNIKTYDELTLILKCDEEKIQLEHHRTKRVLDLVIDLALCPFPWKIVVELPTYGDCVHILQ